MKVYGGELVERLSQRTEEVTDAMRSHVDNFESRVGARTTEAATIMDERINRLGEALDGRIGALNEALGARVMEIAKSLADGGKEVVGALEKRIDRRERHDRYARHQARRDAACGAPTRSTSTLGARALEIANTLDGRITRFQELLVGRVETVASQIEVRGQSVGNAIVSRMEQLSQAIRGNAGEAERSLGAARGLDRRGDPHQRARGRAHHHGGVGRRHRRDEAGRRRDRAAADH